MRRYNLNFVYAVVESATTNYANVVAKPSTATNFRKNVCIARFMRAGSIRFYTQNSGRCWNCQEELQAMEKVQFMCSKCGSLLKVPEVTNYFHLLGLEKQFTIDLTRLTKEFRLIQSVLHPDKFSNKNDEEQALSADWSSLVNKAYKTLQSPIKRGEYLLELHDVAIPEANSDLDKEFLLEMMERNEEVDEAENEQDLVNLLTKVREDMKESVAKLEKSLNSRNFDEAKSNIITLRYFISLENSIKEKGRRIGVHL